MKKIQSLAIVFLVFKITIVAQTTIISTTTGGDWSAGSTWVGGIVPDNTNMVVINGPVTHNGFTAVNRSFTINAGATFTNNGVLFIEFVFLNVISTDIFTINGTITNNNFISITGRTTLGSSGIINQTAANTQFVFNGSRDGNAATSIPDGAILFECNGNTTNMTNGKFIITNAPYGATSQAMVVNYQYFGSNGLTVQFGNTSAASTLNPEGILISRIDPGGFEFSCKDLIVDNTMNTGGPQKVTFSNTTYVKTWGDITNNGSLDVKYYIGMISSNQNLYGIGFNNFSAINLFATLNLQSVNDVKIGIVSFGGGGRIILNSTNVAFVSTLYSNISANFRINGTGKLKVQIPPSSSIFIPVSTTAGNYVPFTISSNASHIQDSFFVSVNDGIFLPSQPVVKAIWDIEEKTIGGSNINLSLGWYSTLEQPSFNRNACYITHYIGGGWDVIPPTAAAGPNVIFQYTQIRNNITSFSPFTVTSSLFSLPIKWLSVNASILTANTVAINWQVEESNISEYRLQKSTDGVNFITFKIISSLGNGTHTYREADKPMTTGKIYYRIEQKSIDASTTYSKVVSVNIASGVKIHSNLITNQFQFSITNSNSLNKHFAILDATGKIVVNKKINSVTTTIDTRTWNAGVYYLNLENDKVYKIVKQ